MWAWCSAASRHSRCARSSLLRAERGFAVEAQYQRSSPTPLVLPSSALPSPVLRPGRSVDSIDPALVDTFGRRHNYLRVSLTDRCNLRCTYCMPEEGEEALEPNVSGDILTAAELHRLVGLFVGMGVRKVRLTGGEPTIRGDFARIVEGLGELSASLPEPLEMGITTNGVRLQRFLPELRKAGLFNINLSLDTLVAAKFPLMTRRPPKWHDRVMKVVDEVASQDFSLKINCVLMRGANGDEIGSFVDLTEHRNLEVRFLEFMPFVANSWSEKQMLPQAEAVEMMQRHLVSRGLPPAEKLPPDSLNDVARLWKVPGFKGRIGFISSMTDAFCGGCNRLRLTANGEIRNCLFGEEGWSLRDQMRAGADDNTVAATIASGVKKKYAKMGGKKDMHELNERGGHALSMMALGG